MLLSRMAKLAKTAAARTEPAESWARKQAKSGGVQH
jgi:hypothetical protein